MMQSKHFSDFAITINNYFIKTIYFDIHLLCITIQIQNKIKPIINLQIIQNKTIIIN
jgi:hypothetical protein